MFSVCTFLASIADGGGGLAATQLTSDIIATAIIIPPANTTDFLSASVAHPLYIVINDEVIKCTSKDATHFYLTSVADRGVADPIVTTIHNPAAAHAVNTMVYTIEVNAMDTFMGYNVTTSSATFGVYEAMTFLGRMFANLPKFILWNYNFLNSGPAIMLKFLILYPLSAGFVVSFCIALVSWGMGLFRL